jgi:hypothetical protein
MLENEKVLGEIPAETDTAEDYITAINSLKQNSVDKAKYEQLRNENKRLLDSIVNGRELQETPVKENIDVQALRNDLFKENSELTNLEFIEKSLKLRDALLEEDPSNDIFVARGHNIAPTPADYETAERIADVYRQCVEYADGDSEIFTQELMRRTNDVMPNARRKR